MIEMSSASSFCSNPDALGFDESEKGIFGSLKNIAQLLPSLPKEGDWVADSAAGDAGNLVVREADKKSPAASAGECLWLRSTGFFVGLFANVFVLSDKQGGDRPRSPLPVADVDLIPVEGSTAVVRGILDCHCALAVSGFLWSGTFIELSSTPILTLSCLIESG